MQRDLHATSAAIHWVFEAYTLLLSALILVGDTRRCSGATAHLRQWSGLNAAQSTNAQMTLESMFRGITVGEVMNRKPTTVPATISLQRLVDEYFLPYGRGIEEMRLLSFF